RLLGEREERAAAGPVPQKTKLVALLEPSRHLFYRCPFEVSRQRRLPSGGSRARHDVASSVGDTGELWAHSLRHKRQRKDERDYAGLTNQVVHARLFDP